MDNSKLTISLLLVAFLLIIVTLVTLRKNKINVKVIPYIDRNYLYSNTKFIFDYVINCNYNRVK